MILTAPSVIKQKGFGKCGMYLVKNGLKRFPTYNIKYAFSRNGKNWTQTGKFA